MKNEWQQLKVQRMEEMGVGENNAKAAEQILKILSGNAADQVEQILRGNHNANNVLAAVFERH